MAERRMFAKTIIDSDAFLELPLTAQLLYFHLAMRADDDGFCNKPITIMRMCGAKQEDLKTLTDYKFLITFDSGVVVIKHWRIHNYIRKDTYNETKYKFEKASLYLDENNAYSENFQEPVYELIEDSSTSRGRAVDESLTQVRIGKDRLGKDSLDNKGKTKVFSPPTLEEVSSYCIERKNNVNPQHFIDHYSARGWMIGKNKMKDWKAAVRTWERNDFNDGKQSVYGNASSSTEESTSKWNLKHSN